MIQKDIPRELVSETNKFFINKNGYQLIGTNVIRRKDFSDSCSYHFDECGNGYRHMAVFNLTLLKEFFTKIFDALGTLLELIN